MRVHRWLSEPSTIEDSSFSAKIGVLKARAKVWLKQKGKLLRYCGKNRAPEAARVAQTLLLHSAFAKEYPMIAPELGLQIIRERQSLKFVRADVLFNFIQVLQADTNSMLYWELQNNQNLRGRHRYDINPVNLLPSGLFGDARTVTDIAAYKAIGDAVISELCQRR